VHIIVHTIRLLDAPGSDTLGTVPAPEGFTHEVRKNGDVVILHHGKPATTLRGARAHTFLDDLADAAGSDDQELMARLTGNYRRGNERVSSQHPRNRPR
jgi:hypothetical protein